MKLPRFQPTIKHLEEPFVEVGQSIAVPEPKMGWTLLGPLGSKSSYEIDLGLIGDSESLEMTKNLMDRLNVTTYGKDETFLHVDFPGLDKLKIKFNVKWTAEIDEKEIKQLDNTGSFFERVETASRIIQEKIKALMDRDPSPDVLVLTYPKKIDYYCIEGAIGRRAIPRKTSLEKYIERMRAQHVTLDKFFVTPLPPPRSYKPVDLRSIIKAICMQHDVPIQIIRPHTTEPYDPQRPKREDDATTFWNLVVAMFYKANNIPWQVKGLMKDTCYIGISFFRDRGDSATVKTALAQVFSLDAEGFVFKGDKATVDENNAPHVSKNEAIKLLQQAIDVYKRNKDGELPKRVVVHKTSRFDDGEKEGFLEGAKEVHKLDLVAFGTRDIKLMRWGTNPPIRGTMVRLPDNSVLLYTSGYIPYLDVYPGPRVPSPLEILEHHGQTSIDIICKEILALTKLNWNNAKFCTKAPITIGFARRVGAILREAPPDIKIKDIGAKFKFYM